MTNKKLTGVSQELAHVEHGRVLRRHVVKGILGETRKLARGLQLDPLFENRQVCSDTRADFSNTS
jgi:hypothetical protein